MAKPAAIEARKAKAVEDLAARVQALETKIDRVLSLLESSASEELQETVEPEAQPEEQKDRPAGKGRRS